MQLILSGRDKTNNRLRLTPARSRIVVNDNTPFSL